MGPRIARVILAAEKALLGGESGVSRPYHPRYLEPFCGFCGVLRHFNTDGRERVAGDLNGDIIAMWQAVQSGWLPPSHVSQEEFYELKSSPGPSAMRGYVGHAFGFGGQFFQGYCPTYSKRTDFGAVGLRSLKALAPQVQDVRFESRDYREWENCVASDGDAMIGPRTLVYMDPPYSGCRAKCVKSFVVFDSPEFWRHAANWSAKGALVFVSERRAPDGWVPIWTHERSTSWSHHAPGLHRSLERLYVDSATWERLRTSPCWQRLAPKVGGLLDHCHNIAPLDALTSTPLLSLTASAPERFDSRAQDPDDTKGDVPGAENGDGPKRQREKRNRAVKKQKNSEDASMAAVAERTEESQFPMTTTAGLETRRKRQKFASSDRSKLAEQCKLDK